MIYYGLKLWSSNIAWFQEAVERCRAGEFDFIELYYNPAAPLDFDRLQMLKGLVRVIHNPHSHGWHEFFFASDEQRNQWRETQRLADFFACQFIVVHPSRDHTLISLIDNIRTLADARILVENMAGRDIDGASMAAGQTLADLTEVKKYAPICFDLEKAVKAAVYQGLDYKDFISQAVTVLQPFYFHISGGDLTPIDQHFNLWEASFDMHFIKQCIEQIARNADTYVVFEVPKVGNTLENDFKNVDCFRNF